jgi:hypothetical protein
MKNGLPSGDLAVYQKPRHTMGALILALEVKGAVTTSERRRQPGPALIAVALIDLVPESF